MEEKPGEHKKAEELSPSITGWITPPFRYYMVLSFFITTFWVILDGIYRSDAFLTRLKGLLLIRNGIFLWLSIFFLMLLLSLLLWGFDVLTYLFFFRKKTSPDSKENKFVNYISGFLYFSVFAYVNIIYLRLYLSSFIPGMTKNGKLVGIGTIASASIVVALLIYVLSARKILHSKTLGTVIHRLFKPVLAVLIIFCIVFAFVFLFIWKGSPVIADNDTSNTSGKPNILLITLDNMRSSSMSLYGFDLKTTPFLEKYADECTVFDNMNGGSNQTLTSMPIIISGRYLRRQFPSPPSFYEESLPKALMKAGYSKRCFVSQLSMNMFPRKLFSEFLILNDLKGDPVRSLSWLGKSRESLVWFSYFFSEDDHFFNIFSVNDPRDLSSHRTATIMSETYEYIVRTFRESKEPVFIWAHFMKTHPPFNPPEIFKERFTQSYNPEINNYNACVRYVDYELGNIIKRLKAEGLYDNTLIVISSDHGFYFEAEFVANQIRFEKSPRRSYMRLTGPMTNLPLIIHEPGQKDGKRLKVFAAHYDIAPTILELSGVKVPDEMDGESLVPYIRGLREKSDEVKLTSSGEYFFFQNNLAFDEDINREFFPFCAYYDHYAVEFALYKSAEKKGKEMKRKADDEEFPCHLIGIYDINNDKLHRDNLIDQQGMKALAEKVLEFDWVKYYENSVTKYSPKK